MQSSIETGDRETEGHPGEQAVHVKQESVLVASCRDLQAKAVLRVPPRGGAGPPRSLPQEGPLHQGCR